MEISQHQGLDQEIFSDPNQMANFDLVCYVYDSSDTNSFGYITSIRVPHAFGGVCDARLVLSCVAKISIVAVDSERYCR